MVLVLRCETGALRRRAAELPQVAGPAQSQVQDQEEAGAEADVVGAGGAPCRAPRAEHRAAAARAQHAGRHPAAAAGAGVHGPAHSRRAPDGRRDVAGHDGNAAAFLTGRHLQGALIVDRRDAELCC